MHREHVTWSSLTSWSGEWVPSCQGHVLYFVQTCLSAQSRWAQADSAVMYMHQRYALQLHACIPTSPAHLLSRSYSTALALITWTWP